MKEIFISYARDDGKTAIEKISAALKENQYDFWLDTIHMESSEIYLNHINRAIRQCVFLLFVITPKSIQSERCKEEWNLAINLNKKIIPLLFDSAIQPSDLPEPIRKYNWIDFTKNFEDGENKLINQIKKGLENKQNLSIFQDIIEFEDLCHKASYDLAYEALTKTRGIRPHMYKVVDILSRQGNYDQLIDFHRKLEGKLKAKYEIENLRQLGLAFRWKGDLLEGERYLKLAKNEATKSVKQAKIAEGKTLCDLGAVYLVQGELNKAIEHHTKSLKIAKELKDYENIAFNLRELGPCYEDQGDIDAAIDTCKKALEVIQEHNLDKHEGGVHLNLGNYYVRLGLYDKALREYGKAESWYNNRDGYYGRGWGLVQYRRAYVNLVMNHITDAKQLCHNVIPHLDSMELQAAQNEARYFLGLIYLSEANLSEAKKWIDEAKSYNHLRFIQNIYVVDGIIALKQGDSLQAIELFNKAKEFAESKLEACDKALDGLDMKGIALVGLALCGKEFLYSEAIESFKKARELNHTQGTLDYISYLFDLMVDLRGDNLQLENVRAIATNK